MQIRLTPSPLTTRTVGIRLNGGNGAVMGAIHLLLVITMDNLSFLQGGKESIERFPAGGKEFDRPLERSATPAKVGERMILQMRAFHLVVHQILQTGSAKSGPEGRTGIVQTISAQSIPHISGTVSRNSSRIDRISPFPGPEIPRYHVPCPQDPDARAIREVILRNI